ncbi:MspA family porin [Nocardia sp. NPDC006044]|uniref:MspA family porin n=1 Tax=Nocardia sp. NPDC006044 TaxID=3364306 RepID=UPI00368252D9
MINRKKLARAAGLCAAATMAVGLFSTGAASADTFIPLPGGELVKTLSDGTVVTVRLTNESANISPSMGSTPVHRNAWVSGSASVDIQGAKGGAIIPGYVVGCQVNIAGGGAEGGMTAGTDWEGKSPKIGATTGANLSLGPGQATSFYVIDREKADDFGNEVHKKSWAFKGESASTTWADETIGLSGCGGYAQARSFVKVEVETDNVITWVVLWGQPFSLG